MSDDALAIKYAQDKFVQQQSLASKTMSTKSVNYGSWDGTSLSAPKYTLREGILNAEQNFLGDSKAANLAVGVTKAALYTPDAMYSTFQASQPLALLRSGANLATSLYNDTAGTIRGGVESLQDGFRLLNSEKAAGDRARGELAFNIFAPAGAAKLGRFSLAGRASIVEDAPRITLQQRNANHNVYVNEIAD